MGNWTTISTSDIRDYLASDELDALSAEALGDGQADPLPTILADVVKRVRSEIAAHSANSLDPTSGTVPPELKGAAIALAVEAAYARLPGIALSADHVRLANAARALLKRVADGDVAVTAGISTTSTGDDSGTTTSTPRVVLVASRERPLSGSSMAGL
ncbi:MAG TPA: hypothetical protein PKI32_04215 [Opitutales bacterium]|nr:hypothetical protein [Opitutales bacterium]